MPKFTLSNSFRFGSRREAITNFDSESIETILKKLNKDWLGQFAREEQMQADLIGWKKMLLKINEVLDDALEKQTKEESVKKWLGKLRNLACDVDYLLDEFQTEAFQKMLLLDDDVMSTVKEVNARLQDIASQIKQLDLRKKSGRKSRNVRGVISSAVRRGRGGRDPGPTIYSHPGLAFLQMKIFSKSEMIRATKNFDRSRCLSQGGFVSVYKGVLHDNIQVAVKTYRRADKIRITERELLRIISQVNHKNVVKILGLCLETEVPLLVYEFASNGTLLDHIRCESSQVLKTWKTCLRIAAETASALDYLHSLASPPIIHGDVKSANILLNDNYTAKVADFESSVLISSDAETAMSTILIGTCGYLDPECINTGKLTKKSDVYSFGVVLAELLTGKKPGSCMTLASNKKISMVPYFLNSIKNNGLRQILNFHVANESEMKEIEIVAELASKCLRTRGNERPTMKQVSEELDRLRRLHENFWAQKKTKETEHLLGESSSYATAVIAQPDAQTVVSIDIENYYGDDAMDKFDSMAMSKVKDVNARFQDIASQIDLLGLKESLVEKSRNARQRVSTTPSVSEANVLQISDAQRGGGGDPGTANFSRSLIEKAKDLAFLHQPVPIFTKSELLQATGNYDTRLFLGEGGFASVYKGVLPDCTPVAVKKPKAVGKIPINQVFQHELRVVSQINHKNVVKILGACLETKVPLLVYEFVPNGTLFDHIHDKSSQVLRNWKTCLRIAAETASALDYLHSSANPPIIHGDVKSTNILLDDNYKAKVADFGSSVLISSDNQTAMTTKKIGTFLNLDPEYVITGKLTEKSDAYSFGVLLAELLTGLKPGSGMTLASNEGISMVQYFLYSIENNSLRQILNVQVADESEMEEIETVAGLASKCLSLSGRRRPTMKQVSEELDRLKISHENL
ncbi:hypothetical protein AB3S75_027015 [Citrus x aurantiifolia]